MAKNERFFLVCVLLLFVRKGTALSNESDQNAGSDHSVVLYDSRGIIAVNSLYYFNLNNSAHLRSSH
jgi:hypothetical protein